MRGVSYTSHADSFYVGSFSYTSRAAFIFMLGVSLTHSVLVSPLISCVSLTHPMLALFLSGKFFLHIPCWLYFSVGGFSDTCHDGSFSNPGSFSYTSRAVFIFICRISLKHPVLLHFYLGSFSYTSHADFVFMWGVSLTQPVLASFLSGSFSYISHDDVNFI